MIRVRDEEQMCAVGILIQTVSAFSLLPMDPSRDYCDGLQATSVTGHLKRKRAINKSKSSHTQQQFRRPQCCQELG